MTSNLVVSVSGKGGVGKTTTTALLLKYFVEKRVEPILVVDADPDSNMPDVLGIKLDPRQTVGAVAADLKKKIEKGSLSPTQTKAQILEGGVYSVLQEEEHFDLLVMGRAEGEGCYCYINSVLTGLLDTLTKQYPVTLMDMEAGLEHLSRRTDRDVDAQIVVTDASKMGLQTAERVVELSEEVHLKFKSVWIVGNRFPESAKPLLREVVDRIRERGLNHVELAGFIPADDQVAQFNITDRSLLELPEGNPAYVAVRGLAQKILP
ncbi:MAG: AAA family ATPase [Promethearchaeota archaeon]